MFAEATLDQATYIKKGLDMFYKASGQRVNYSKSVLFVSPNIEPQAAVKLCESLCIPLKNELGHYLGHTLVHKGRSGSQSGDIRDRVKRKLDGWKAACLSKAGRLTLAKLP